MHIMTNGHFPYPGDDRTNRVVRTVWSGYREKAFHMVKRTLFSLRSEVCLLQREPHDDDNALATKL